jgi:zinc transporter ZupT
MLGLGAVLGIIPLLLGYVPVFLMSGRRRLWVQFSAGVALGFLSIFFTELIDDSGFLGMSTGLPLTNDQVVLSSLFVLGFVCFMFLSEMNHSARSVRSRLGTAYLAYLVAAGIGLHSLGEGMIIGNSLASQVPIFELSSIFQGVSFSLHKFLEGFTLAVFYELQPRVKTAMICTGLASLPLLIGIPFGASTYPAVFAGLFFAAGAGAVIFMILQLAPLVKTSGVGYAVLFGFIVGFVLVYVGSLIHYTASFY